MICDPNSEMTSVSFDLQNGQDLSLPPCGGGSGWGVFASLPRCRGGSGWGVLPDDSLPPCGGGSGWGVFPDDSLPPCGGGSGWGVALPTSRRHVALLGQSLQHLAHRLVDAARCRPAAEGVPFRPIDRRVRHATLDSLFQQPPQVADAVG